MKKKKSLVIGIDATCINSRSSGAKQRFLSLYNEVFKQVSFADFIIFTSDDYDLRSSKKIDHLKNLKFIKTPIKSNNSFLNIIKSYFYWRKITKSFKIDIFETYRLPIFQNSSKINILTIHDLRYLYWNFSGIKTFFNTIYCNFFLKNIDNFIVVSKFTKNQLSNILGYRNITVVENGINRTTFKKISKQNIKIFKKENLSNFKFVFTVGHFEKRKNYINLVRSIKILRDKNVQLIIAGNANTKEEIKYKNKLQNLIYENKLNYRIKLFTNLNDDEIKWLYKNCELFIFPSTYEGFGIPILEAMVFEKKITLSNISPFKEVIKYQKNIFFNPNNPKDIANKIKINFKKTSNKVNFYQKNLKYFENKILALKICNLYKNLNMKK